jgi:uncharacterized RDD family membrane protein YckC
MACGVRRNEAGSPSAPDYASFPRRTAAYLLDELGKTLIWIAIIATFVLFTSGSGPSSDSGDVLALLPRLVLGMGYDWIFWTQGWTPGSAIMEIRITDAEGRPSGPRRAAIRVFGSLLSGAAFLVGYAWMLRSPRRQTWHDIMAGTVVVRVPKDARRGEQRD